MTNQYCDNITDNLLVSESDHCVEELFPFNEIRQEYVDGLKPHMSIQTLAAGQTVFERGVEDHQHVYLLSGLLSLVYRSNVTVTVDASSVLHPIGHVQPRDCRAIAKTDCTLIRIDSERVDRTLCWSQVADYVLAELAVNRFYDEDIHWIETVLKSNLFSKTPPINAEQILARLTPMVVYKDEWVLRQGELADCCYFIKQGTAEVLTRNAQTNQMEVVAEISAGRCFGEDALVNETIRNASVRMSSNGILMRLEKSDFLVLLDKPLVDQVSFEMTKQFIDTPVFIDVRSTDEFSAGHITGAANIPVPLMGVSRRKFNPETPYILYCDTGRRSEAMTYLLAKQGYNVYCLKDGYLSHELSESLEEGDGHFLNEDYISSPQ